ncbi:MAG: ribosomal RNA small subunit methyltransferase B [Planctomycetaceae bacterium]|nr:MAG: ribosomal RNA small subunit methyltransferase B [Planctomycetaceae bacterium]
MKQPARPAFACSLLSPRTAREWAVWILEQHRLSGRWLHDVWEPAWSANGCPSSDRALLHELVTGVVRRRRTLQTVLAQAIDRPWSRLEPTLKTLLELGAYQLLLMERIPPHAAVHETVELTRWLGRHRWAGLVNAVLRQVGSWRTEEYVEAPAPNALPLTHRRWRRLTHDLFPQPDRQPVAYVSRAYSLPHELALRWTHHAGWPEVLAWADACNTPPPIYFRVRTQQVTIDALLKLWAEHGIQARQVAGLPLLCVDSASGLETWPGYHEGWWVVQDRTAYLAGQRLSLQPGETVWDVCAAPGTKTTQLADAVGSTGKVWASDVDPRRLDKIQENVHRLQLTQVVVQQTPADALTLPPDPCDAVLLDAPCSNTGVLARRPEARWRFSTRQLRELAQRQLRLLLSASAAVRPGGRLLYATCSVEPEENELLIRQALPKLNGWQLLVEQTIPPGQQGDGGYHALLVSTASAW